MSALQKVGWILLSSRKISWAFETKGSKIKTERLITSYLCHFPHSFCVFAPWSNFWRCLPACPLLVLPVASRGQLAVCRRTGQLRLCCVSADPICLKRATHLRPQMIPALDCFKLSLPVAGITDAVQHTWLVYILKSYTPFLVSF